MVRPWNLGISWSWVYKHTAGIQTQLTALLLCTDIYIFRKNVEQKCVSKDELEGDGEEAAGRREGKNPMGRNGKKRPLPRLK